MLSKGQYDDLLVRLHEGDESAFSDLFYLFKDKLYSFLFDFTKSSDIAEDMVQNVFVKIWQDRERILDISNLNAYLFKVARNMTIDYMRKYAREAYPLDVFLENTSLESDLDPHNEFINNELRNKIKQAVSNLPPQQQKVYILHSEQGLEHDEIARMMNLSASTIRTHLMHATATLRNALSHLFSHLLTPLVVFFLQFFK